MQKDIHKHSTKYIQTERMPEIQKKTRKPVREKRLRNKQRHNILNTEDIKTETKNKDIDKYRKQAYINNTIKNQRN